MSDEPRLEHIELRLAYLEQALQELSDVVYRQQLELDLAREAQRQAFEQLARLEGSGARDTAGQERPPHY